MEKFIRELESGEFHLRDKWQLELKSDFFPLPNKKTNKYTQEFYVFVPNSLQINESTYTKDNFFKDQTNFIRYKTPVFTFEHLNDVSNKSSPFYKIHELLNKIDQQASLEDISDEVKLLGNIVRSSLRKRALVLSKIITSDNFRAHTQYFLEEIQQLQKDLSTMRHRISNLKKEFFNDEKGLSLHIRKEFLYMDEFISNSIHYYLTGILQMLRNKDLPENMESDLTLSQMIVAEDTHKKSISSYPDKISLSTDETEFISYRAGLLNKFVLDALLLKTTRTSPDKKLQSIIGSFAAGIAMAIYFSLFIWQGHFLLINSELFIMGTVILYILKDRIKDSIKSSSYKMVYRWVYDFKTKVLSSDNKTQIGTLKECFSFAKQKDVPEEIMRVRNKEFHYVLEDFPRPESIIRYKKTIEIEHPSEDNKDRKYNLNMIFRFNILRFLAKADDPYESYFSLNPENYQLTTLSLPKTYHVNIIMKNTFITEEDKLVSEIKKFRLILDKNGIKRVEHVR